MSGVRLLIVGSGAREHALAWRLATDPGVAQVISAPGTPLMEDVAQLRPDVAASDHDGIVRLAQSEAVDLVVVGPEAPLVAGLADRLHAAGIAAFGPTAAAAELEGSKAFAREVCMTAGVAMARGSAFDSVSAAIEYAKGLGDRVVVKADGLAAGKGVTLCSSLPEAEASIREVLVDGRFGTRGGRVIVEEWLDGVEASVIALCDGETQVLLPAARDHKRLGEDDTGSNTGGMGAYSPVPELDETDCETLRHTVFAPILAEMARRGTRFRGALFAGLMLTADGPRVLEFNARLGDPEAQAILPRLAEPLLPLLLAAATGTLTGRSSRVATAEGATVALTLAADGYPESPRSGDLIVGIEGAREAGALVFGAGIRADGHGGMETAGGRVLTVVGRGADVESAAQHAYEAAALIEFQGKVVRRDIGRTLVGAAA